MKIPISGQPDKKYIEARNRLIPEAERYANKLCGKKPPKKTGKKADNSRDEWNARWNRTFHSKMNQLWRDHAA